MLPKETYRARNHLAFQNKAYLRRNYCDAEHQNRIIAISLNKIGEPKPDNMAST